MDYYNIIESLDHCVKGECNECSFRAYGSACTMNLKNQAKKAITYLMHRLEKYDTTQESHKFYISSEYKIDK